MPAAITSGQLLTVARRGFGSRRHDGLLLVVDDTCASGRQTDRLRFVESDDAQAQDIATRTGRPVFSVARNDVVRH